MRVLRIVVCLAWVAGAVAGGCSRGGSRGEEAGPVYVAAAASLHDAFGELAGVFTRKTGIAVNASYGATGDLARQIENGAPFEVFASADAAHVDGLAAKGLILADTRAAFARGRLVLWVPRAGDFPGRVEDLTDVRVTRLAVAKPDVAPYGRAAVETLKSLGLWERVEPKIVYSQNVAQAKQFAGTGNADAAFLPLALVREGEGHFVEVDGGLHAPIEHVIAVVKGGKGEERARRFVEFILSGEGRAILEKYGYRGP